jgi:hypothetical protein
LVLEKLCFKNSAVTGDRSKLNIISESITTMSSASSTSSSPLLTLCQQCNSVIEGEFIAGILKQALKLL